MTAPDLNDEWENFLLSMKQTSNISIQNVSCHLNVIADAAAAPVGAAAAAAAATTTALPALPDATALSISTKTKVLFLNQPIDIINIFWKIPVLDYWQPRVGVVKKIVKIVCLSPEEQDALEARLSTVPSYQQDIIKQINIQTPTKTKFKDERKISVGISKKDIMACRGKKKNVFYNCFSLVLRILYKEFREIHVKIFNTGKMEIPGIVDDEILEITRAAVLMVLRPFVPPECDYRPAGAALGGGTQNVLINSNFNCGFYIHREKLHNILKSEKYYLDTSFDPCTYPGVKIKFYFNHELGFDVTQQRGRIMDCDRHAKMKNIQADKKYTEVSIMIFRTGSGLIVGNCSDAVLDFIFHFILEILREEYYYIGMINTEPAAKPKTVKIRRKTIYMGGAAAAAATI